MEPSMGPLFLGAMITTTSAKAHVARSSACPSVWVPFVERILDSGRVGAVVNILQTNLPVATTDEVEVVTSGGVHSGNVCFEVRP